MADQDPMTCPHTRVDRSVSEPHVWMCQPCGMTFLPTEALAQVEDEYNAIIDNVTGVFSNVLWDLHSRAFAQHGIPHDGDNPIPEAVCEERGHNRDDSGVCRRCGDSPFLGGGQ